MPTVSENELTFFEKAQQIIVRFNEIYDYERRLVFWENHPEVFGGLEGNGVVILKKDGIIIQYSGDFHKDGIQIDLPADNYLSATILPVSFEEYQPFHRWCIEMDKSNKLTLYTEEQYWKEIKKHHSPESFLDKLRFEAENLRKNAIKPPSPFSAKEYYKRPYTLEQQRAFHFWHGVQEPGRGGSWLETTLTLLDLLKRTRNFKLIDYSYALFGFDDGRHTSKMAAFLWGQGIRLKRGEDITINPKGGAEEIPTDKEAAISVKNDARVLAQFYLSQFGGRPLTSNNKTDFAKEWGVNGDGSKLRQTFLEFSRERLVLSENRKSDNARLETFEQAINLLKSDRSEIGSKALVKAVAEYNTLKDRVLDFYSHK